MRPSHSIHLSAALGLIVVLSVLTTTIAHGSASDSVQIDQVNRAAELFRSGRHQDVVALLRPLTVADLPPSQRILALELLGRSFVRIGRPLEADTTFYRLAETDPGWTPSEETFTPDELTVANQALRRQREDRLAKQALPGTTPLWKQKRVWIPAAAVTVASVTLCGWCKCCLWCGCDDNPPQLPDPPLPPTGQ